MNLIYYILTLHWFGDFCLQTDWMATNKSRRITALLSHIICYGICLMIGLYVYYSDYTVIWKFVTINTGSHFLIDWVSSKITRSLYANRDNHNFFVIIGLDQLAHLFILIRSYEIFLK